MNNNKIYIIIVTYNGTQWLAKCLESCTNYTVIVVDNASTDNTVSYIKTNYPEITLLLQKENKGFGQANNIGISYALKHGAEHVLLLNQDAYLLDDSLAQLIDFQKNNIEYGIVSPVHISADQSKLDKNFSNYMTKEVSGAFYSDFVLNNSIKKVYSVPFVNAAAWLVSKRCLEAVGGFDPLFFHYGEDDNYCQRVIYHGFNIGVLPKIFVIHDRATRKHNEITEFSDVYYENKLRAFKRKQANILQSENMDNIISKLQKTVLSLLLQFKFSRSFSYKKELELLKQVKPEILESRKINKTVGKHYLVQIPI